MATEPAFHRRILIEPGEGRAIAALEDDWHRMEVTLHHADGMVMAAIPNMIRWPWSQCPGAMAQLQATFTGVALADFARRGERSSNCTHLHDLALFGAAHADGTETIAYDVSVTDPVGGAVVARLARNGSPLLCWHLQDDHFTAPDDLAGSKLWDMGGWIATLDRPMREAARILRWATIMAHGRSADMPAGMSAMKYASGNCFNFQPETAAASYRREDVHTDFSQGAQGPLAERADAFANR